LEVPGENPSEGVEGWKMATDPWSSCQFMSFQTISDVEQALFVELISRLIVLNTMIKKYGKETFTPLQWLLYIKSEQGGKHLIHCYKEVCEAAKDNNVAWQQFTITSLLRNLFGSYREYKDPTYPFIFIDSMEELASLGSVLDPNLIIVDKSMPVMKAVMRVVGWIGIGALWCGNRLEIGDVVNLSAGRIPSGLSNLYSSERQTHIVGHYEYLTREQVRAYL
jgi:hypothetical protein